jgi:hypothetical protein
MCEKYHKENVSSEKADVIKKYRPFGKRVPLKGYNF